MKTVGDRLESFDVTGVKPGFLQPVEHGQAAFETLSLGSFPGKWKVIYFWPKDFTFVCPTEITGFDALSKDFLDRDAVLLGGSMDNEFCKLAWRREHEGLRHLQHWQFADVRGQLVDQLGIRDAATGVPLRATFIVDPDQVIRHVSVNALSVGRSPEEVLRVLDALQTGELCAANRPVGGTTL